jgi:23S rRNA pseudouridine1911/1915/1917 synthase
VKLTEVARDLRFDHAIQQALEREGHAVSVREVRLALKDGRILIDGRLRKPGDRSKGSETVDLEGFTPRREGRIEAEPDLLARVGVVFEDQHLLALSKPSGMPTAPLVVGEKGTLVGAAIARAGGVGSIGPPLEGGLLHRLDTDTSGIVLFAKDEATRETMREDFARHRIEKRYLALVFETRGAIPEHFVAEGAILSRGDRVRVLRPEHAEREALPARTEVNLVRRFRARRMRLVEAVTRTGRRHQIRAHLADAGVPIVGDRLYGQPAEGDPVARLALHAVRITLADRRSFEAPLAEDLREGIEELGRSENR